MTTEVLRNMLYAGSRQLADLGFVVMDEVHYLADRFRGAVWEEVILHLPEHVALVSLSATVSNAEEFGDWLVTVRGDTAVVVDEHRPVPLWQHMMVGSPDVRPVRPVRRDGELVGRPRAGPPDRATWSARAPVVGPRPGGAGPGRRDTRFRPPSRVDGHRPARPRRPAARHHVRVQPRGLRRRRRPVRARRAAAHHRGRGGADPRDDRPPHRRAARRATSPCWATGSGAKPSSAASPPTTRACCPRSRRRSRSCSSAASCGRCSPPRPSRWASTCPPAPWCWNGS